MEPIDEKIKCPHCGALNEAQNPKCACGYFFDKDEYEKAIKENEDLEKEISGEVIPGSGNEKMSVKFYCRECNSFQFLNFDKTCGNCKNPLSNELIGSDVIFEPAKEAKIYQIELIAYQDELPDNPDQPEDENSYLKSFLLKKSIGISMLNIIASFGILIGLMVLSALVQFFVVPLFSEEVQRNIIFIVVHFFVMISIGGALLVYLLIFCRNFIEMLFVPLKYKGITKPKKLIYRYFGEVLNERWAVMFSNLPLAFFHTTQKAKHDFSSYLEFKRFCKKIKPEIKSLISKYNRVNTEDKFSLDFEKPEIIRDENKKDFWLFNMKVQMTVSKDKSVPKIPLNIKGRLIETDGNYLVDSSYFYLLIGSR